MPAEQLTFEGDHELADLYQSLLRVHADPSKKPKEVSHTTDSRLAVSPRRFRGKKVSEAAVIVLREGGESLHAKKILEAIQLGGLKMGGKAPMGTLITAMRRDDRIEKDQSAPNTWGLRNVTNVEGQLRSLMEA